MDCCLPDSPVHGDSPGKNTGWVVISSSRDLPNPGIKPGSLMSPVLALYLVLALVTPGKLRRGDMTPHFHFSTFYLFFLCLRCISFPVWNHWPPQPSPTHPLSQLIINLTLPSTPRVPLFVVLEYLFTIVVMTFLYVFSSAYFLSSYLGFEFLKRNSCILVSCATHCERSMHSVNGWLTLQEGFWKLRKLQS